MNIELRFSFSYVIFLELDFDDVGCGVGVIWEIWDGWVSSWGLGRLEENVGSVGVGEGVVGDGFLEKNI